MSKFDFLEQALDAVVFRRADANAARTLLRLLTPVLDPEAYDRPTRSSVAQEFDHRGAIWTKEESAQFVADHRARVIQALTRAAMWLSTAAAEAEEEVEEEVKKEMTAESKWQQEADLAARLLAFLCGQAAAPPVCRRLEAIRLPPDGNAMSIQETTLNNAGLGFKTWGSAVLLARLCLGFRGLDSVDDVKDESVSDILRLHLRNASTIVELGCGTGVVSIAAAAATTTTATTTTATAATTAATTTATTLISETMQTSATVYATDKEKGAVNTSLENARRNGIESIRIVGLPLDWDAFIRATDVKGNMDGNHEQSIIDHPNHVAVTDAIQLCGRVDVVLAADIAYEREVASLPPVVAARLLRPDGIFAVVLPRRPLHDEDITIFESAVVRSGLQPLYAADDMEFDFDGPTMRYLYRVYLKARPLEVESS